jgi:hypothetical protein
MTAAPAFAASPWQAPANVSPAGSGATWPVQTVDAAGNALAAWTHDENAASTIQVAARPAGGPWQAPLDLSAGGVYAVSADLAANSHGDAIAVWSRISNGDLITQAAMRPAGGAWQQAADISSPGAQDAQVAIDEQGNVIVVWARHQIHMVVESRSLPAGGVWQSSVTLSPPDRDSGSPAVALDPQGDAVVAWQTQGSAGMTTQGATRATGAAWKPAQDLSLPSTSAGVPNVAIDTHGDALVVWERYNGANTIVQSAAHPATGAWGAPSNVSAPGSDAAEPRIAVGSDGTAGVAWTALTLAGKSVARAAVRGPGDGAWQAPVDISAESSGQGTPEIAADKQGNLLALWSRYDGSHYIVQAARRAAGGTWKAPVDVSAATDDTSLPKIAFDAQGDASAIWTHNVPGHSELQGAAYDVTGPELLNLAIPATGVAGQVVSFSVSPFDVWSSRGATSWAFGDGSSATGTAVTHTYASSGTFSVDAGAVDAQGNASSASRSVVIAPGPAAPAVAQAVATAAASAVATPPPAAAPSAALPAPLTKMAKVTGLRLSPRTFRAAKGRGVRAAGPPAGTQVHYALSTAAQLRFTVQRQTAGRKVGGRCVVAAKSNRKRSGCTLWTTVPGAIARSRPAGPDGFAFSGVLGGHALKAARYRLVATPTAGGRAGTPARAEFHVVR